MKTVLSAIIIFILVSSCNTKIDPEEAKKEILETERHFALMLAKEGIAESFHYYADENAVIKRGNELISGKEKIGEYYRSLAPDSSQLSWTPGFIGVSGDGTLGYTYGKYVVTQYDKNGKPVETEGIFHTVWKRQEDGTWKYVWD
jgi:ketosteroid isomerase-like protein